MHKKKISFLFFLMLGLTLFALNKTFMHLAKGEAKKTSLPCNDSFMNGDLIFQVSVSGQGRAIQLASASKYTHVGILFKVGNEWQVYEAVEPVQRLPLKSFIQRGDSGLYQVKRLKNRDSLLKSSQLALLKTYLEQQLKKHYDPYFSWDDETLYCSELVWKAYKRAGIQLGTLRELKTFDLSSPEVKAILKQRYGDQVPYTESVISPGDIFAHPDLEQVCSNGLQ